MKRISTLFLIMALFYSKGFGQVSSYTFAQSTGTFTTITGTTGLATVTGTGWDDNVVNLTIPFTYIFNGTNYTSCYVNANGFLTFGATAPIGTTYAPIASTTAYTGAVAGFSNDLINNGVAITYNTIGTTPNRIFVVQWNSARRYNIASDVLNFQIRLYETSNKAEVVYGANTSSSTTLYSMQVGLRGVTNADYNDRNSTTSWSATTAGTSNAATVSSTNLLMPASGLTFTWTPAATCTGTPVGGSASASVASICPGGSSTLSLTGNTSGGGITYQWQSSATSGGTYTNITGATSATYVASPTTTTYYRCLITCTNGGASGTSSVASVTVTTPAYITFNGTLYTQSFESWVSSCGTNDAPTANWRTVPYTGNNSWRRNDQGTTASWTTTSGGYTPTFTDGSYSARFHSYDATSGSTGSLDLFINMSAATGSTQLNFDYINTSGSDGLKVYQSTDGGVTFTQIGASLIISAAWATQTYTVTSTSATTVIRLQATSDYGTTDIGVDNFKIAATCTGTPVGGSASASVASICPGGSSTLSLTGNTSGGGITYQWQSSATSGGTYTNITGATSATYVASPTTTTYYRCLITCTNGGASGTSSVASVTVTTPAYITFNGTLYTQSFESWVSSCGTNDAPTANWRTVPYTGNNSWRRNDQGTTASWTTTSGGYTPTFTDGSYSARFHSYDATSGSTGSLDLFINMSAATGSTQLNFDYINTSGSDGLKVYQSTDGGVTFTQIGASLVISAAWATQTYTVTSTSATTVIRLQATSDYGTTDIGVDNFKIAATCTGTPVGGSASASVASICPGGSSTLSLTGNTSGGGITYQWQSSATSGGTYTNITGATSATYVASPTTTTYYRCLITCTNGGASGTSSVASVTVTTPAYITFNGTLYTQSFESWVSSCGTNDAPTANWRTVPYTGNNSWRRNDQGTTASWTTTSGGYTPTFTDGSYSARFHSYDATSGSTGSLDLFINMSAATGSTQLNFDYINTSGSDGLKVYQSTDGGVTFTQIGASLVISAAWATQTYTVTSTSATTVIRLQATSDYGTTDIGVDNFKIIGPCSGTPTGGTAAVTPSSDAPGSTYIVSATGYSTAPGLTFQWQSSTNGGTTWNNIGTATTSYAPLTQTAPSYGTVVTYRLVVTCTNSGGIGYSSTATFTSDYCTPTHTYADVENLITRVDFDGTLNDVSNNSGTNSSGYQDFTGLTNKAIQEQGGAVNLNVYANTASTLWNAWVDWNKDGVFSASEQVYSSNNNFTLTTTFGFQIPLTQATGDYRVRIRTADYSGSGDNYSNADIGSCGNLFDGQAEDYLFTVVAHCPAQITAVNDSTRCVTAAATFVLSATGNTGTTAIKWYTAQTGSTLAATTATSGTPPIGIFTTPSLNATTIYWVTAANATCESLVRVPVKADKRPVPSVTFTPASPARICDGDGLSVGGTSSTETADLINEGFESGSLGEFTVVTTNNKGTISAEHSWQVRTSTFVPAASSVWKPAVSSGYGSNKFAFALADISDLYKTTSPFTYIYHTFLTSGAHSTTGFTSLNLAFSLYFDHYLADNATGILDTVTVQTSPDNGTTWNTVQTFIADQGKASNFSSYNYDLYNLFGVTNYQNKTSVRVRFILGAGWTNGVAIDSIRLYGDHPAANSYVWTQVGGIPGTNLYTDLAFTTPYTGGPASQVYLNPTAAQQEDGSPLSFQTQLTASNGCKAIDTLVVNIDDKIWTGINSNDWNTGSNWCGNIAPKLSDRVSVPRMVSGIYPVIKLPVIAKARFLTIDSAASVIIDEGASLQIRRDLFTQPGASFTNNGTLVMVGTEANENLHFPGPGTVAEMNNLVINYTSSPAGDTGVILNAPISIRGRLKDTAGTLALLNSDITLKSKPSGTAYIDVMESTAAFNYNGSGRFIVERYFPPLRAWRFVSVPFSSTTQTINDAWQEGNVYCDYSSCNVATQNGTPGYGTEISYNNNCSIGFDYHNNTYKTSIQTYQNNGWRTPNGTKLNLVNEPSSLNPSSPGYPAYAVFVRGDRTICLSGINGSNKTVLRARGILNQTGQSIIHNLPAGSKNDFVLIGNPYACTIKLNNVLFSQSSNINKNTFWTYNPEAGGSGGTGGYVTHSSADITTPYDGIANGFIQNGQAFMVQLNAPGTPLIQFKETDKAPTQTQTITGVFGLTAATIDQTPSVVYVNLLDTSNAIMDGIAGAFGNQYSSAVDEVDASKRWNEEIENMALIRHDTALAIEFRPMPKSGDTLFFRLYLKQQPYKLKVFSQNLAPGFSSKAWIVDKYLNTETEINLRDTSLYSFKPNTDTNSYRNRFELVFSPAEGRIARLDSLVKKIQVHIYPNPVSGKVFNLAMENGRNDKYTVNIFTATGTMVSTRSINYQTGKFSYLIPLSAKLTSGSYTLQILNSSGAIVRALPLVIIK